MLPLPSPDCGHVGKVRDAPRCPQRGGSFPTRRDTAQPGTDRLQLAELLLEHYPDERAEAMEHLDFAINEFREMKMQPSLERALRHKEILGA